MLNSESETKKSIDHRLRVVPCDLKDTIEVKVKNSFFTASCQAATISQ